MTDPYRHQYGQPQPPAWSQQPAPRRAKGPSRRTRIVLASILGVCLLLITAGLVGAVIGHDKGNAPAPVVPTSGAPAPGVGEGTPGAACATNRLGKTFVKDGVTYTCGGPKPYHWLPPA